MKTSLADIAQQVTSKVAPQWPLPQWVAVNPLWEYRDQPVAQVAAQWHFCGGIHLTMPASFYRQQYQQGNIDFERVTDSMQQALQAALNSRNWLNVSHLLDRHQQRRRKMLWHDEVVFQISQCCGLFLQFPRRFQLQQQESSLYRHWLTISRADRGIETLMDESELNLLFAQLPDTAEQLFSACQASFLQPLSEQALGDYCRALLTDVLGWASALAYQDSRRGSRWVEDLLAIRMAWDYLLWQLAERTNSSVFNQVEETFKQQIADRQASITAIGDYLAPLWQWQQAYEQTQLQRFRFHPREQVDTPAPKLQAVFCIDVRSQRFRQALEQSGREQQLPTQTKGFAGFFGVPLGRETENADPVPHVPGLLKPGFFIDDKRPPKTAKQLLSRVFNSSAGMFAGVEALGLSKLASLLTGIKGSLDLSGETETQEIHRDGKAVTGRQLAEICAQALSGMQFDQFAEQVVLVGHGAKHSNNAQRAGMNCGACGGQTGALSARVLCGLLNESAIRTHLAELGYQLPEQTRFYAALHETVTDDIIWLSDQVPEPLKAVFRQASQSLQATKPKRHKRANHWAELRPEWGLAGNQLLFFGNAQRLSADSPDGHSFLHDYDSSKDADGDLLAGLLSAPGLVANWINWQYYSSVTEPNRLGSGNKLLHNRVANDVGVFEGNGGDLRLGLAWQSVHNGDQLMHQPVRLQVVIEAEESAIRNALAKAADFNQLFSNQWLAVYRLDEQGELSELTA
ncbi:DUF2309 domain-containing protein [Idiomarina seosinensis]|uniref:putative inorganic carbon transporter subunit DabA n=1 Tax=Idiomarina seosinensis TaxID=281739 RepID=UPI00384C99AA